VIEITVLFLWWRSFVRCWRNGATTTRLLEFCWNSAVKRSHFGVAVGSVGRSSRSWLPSPGRSWRLLGARTRCARQTVAGRL